MGRQIQLFMADKDEIKFIEVIKNQGDSIIDVKGQIFDFSELEKLIIESQKKLDWEDFWRHFYKYYIITPEFIIRKDNFNDVDDDASEAIEFSRSEIHNKSMRNGRMWVQLKYWKKEDNGEYNFVTKPEWLNKKFNIYKKWLTKNLKACKKERKNEILFYIGEEAYRMNKQEGYRMMNSPNLEIEFE
jgi:hypothetical protein